MAKQRGEAPKGSSGDPLITGLEEALTNVRATMEIMRQWPEAKRPPRALMSLGGAVASLELVVDGLYALRRREGGGR
jgi:hypothetical protein